MIRTLIFDLGKTIVPFELDRGFRELERFSPHPAAELRKRILGSELPFRFETGRIGPEEFVREISALVESRAAFGEFNDAWNAIFLPEPLIPESAFAALRKNHRLLLLSNTNVLHFEWVAERYPLLTQFDHFVLSYRVGAAKPDAAIYEDALQHAHCEPEECFYTDDIRGYVHAARKLGIDGEQFVGWEPLREQLRLRGVAI